MNPFSTRPATSGAFNGRVREIELLTQRSLGSGESTIIVSEFPNGKGSLVRELHQRLQTQRCRLSFIDAQSLLHGCTPDQFWAQALAQLGATRRSRYVYRDIESLLLADTSSGPCILMIDGIQAIVQLPAFACPDPWGMLRAFTQSQGLVLIATSNADLVSLTAMTRGLTFGSPFFNAMRELVLGPLEDEAAGALLMRAASRLNMEDRAWIIAVAGGSPKLIHLLASCLWERSDEQIRSPTNARADALAECRQELSHIFNAIWPLFPWEERWLMLRVAFAQRCGIEFSRPPIENTPRRPPPDASAEGALVRLIEERLSRGEIKRLLREIAGHTLEMLLPGDSAAGLDFYAVAASVLTRHGLVPCFLDRMLQWMPACAEDISGVASHWECSIRPPTDRWQPINIHTQRLMARGLLERTFSAPGWMVTPPLLYWWLLDQLQALASACDLARWMSLQQLDGVARLSLAEAKVFGNQVERYAGLLRGGATLLVNEAAR